jgi:hypothetical protein
MTFSDDDAGDDSQESRLLPEWVNYLQRFPSVGEALAAARRGEDTSVGLGDAVNGRMQVIPLRDSDGGIIESVYYLDYLDAVETALVNAAHDGHPDASMLRNATRTWVATALLEPGIEEWLAGARGVSSDTEAAQIARDLQTPLEVIELDVLDDYQGERLPRIGIREVQEVDGTESWDDKANNTYGIMAIFAEAIRFEKAPPSLIRVLLDAGARLVTCPECRDYLTDGYPQWPGVSCALDEEGPVCQPGLPPAAHHAKNLLL